MLVAIGAVCGWCVVMVVLSSSRLGVVVSSCGVVLLLLWCGCHLLWSWLWSVVVVVGHLLSKKTMTNDVIIHHLVATLMTWHLLCGEEGDGLWVLTWGWIQCCHHQMSIDVPHCHLPSTCQLLMWHFCVVQMVYWHVQVVVGGWW